MTRTETTLTKKTRAYRAKEAARDELKKIDQQELKAKERFAGRREAATAELRDAELTLKALEDGRDLE